MKILVTGVNGQLGHDVVLEGERRGIEMFGTCLLYTSPSPRDRG